MMGESKSKRAHALNWKQAIILFSHGTMFVWLLSASWAQPRDHWPPRPGVFGNQHTIAYCWDELNTTEHSNLLPWYRINQWDVDRHGVDHVAAEVASALDEMPVGHRVVQLWGDMINPIYDDITWLRDENGIVQGYDDPLSGEFIPYESIWPDDAIIQKVSGDVQAIFQAMVQASVEVDFVALDIERGWSNWILNRKADDYGGDACRLAGFGDDPAGCDQFQLDSPEAWSEFREQARLNRDAYYQAIWADPRFDDSVLPFIPQITDPITISRYWEYHGTPQQDHYLMFNALMKERSANYLNSAVYDVVSESYPTASMTNYAFVSSTPEVGVPDLNGHRTYLYSSGPVVGDTQSRSHYGSMGQLTTVRPPGDLPENGFSGTSYNAMLYEVNKIRSQNLSSSLPITPWIAYKHFGLADPSNYLADNDHYQEMVFHVLLTIAGKNPRVLFWNPHADEAYPHRATAADNALLSACLMRTDRALGYSDHAEPLIDELVQWDADYVWTRVRVHPGLIVSRFTPRIDPETGQTADALLLNDNPATYQIREGVIELPNTRVVHVRAERTLSWLGHWLVETE